MQRARDQATLWPRAGNLALGPGYGRTMFRRRDHRNRVDTEGALRRDKVFENLTDGGPPGDPRGFGTTSPAWRGYEHARERCGIQGYGDLPG